MFLIFRKLNYIKMTKKINFLALLSLLGYFQQISSETIKIENTMTGSSEQKIILTFMDKIKNIFKNSKIVNEPESNKIAMEQVYKIGTNLYDDISFSMGKNLQRHRFTG